MRFGFDGPLCVFGESRIRLDVREKSVEGTFVD
jgi:hypothetical protein